MKDEIFEVRKGSFLHRWMIAAIEINSNHINNAYWKMQFLQKLDNLNICETLRHMLIWNPLYVLANLLLWAVPIYAVFVYPVAHTSYSGSVFGYYMIGGAIVGAMIGFFWIRSTIRSKRRMEQRNFEGSSSYDETGPSLADNSKTIFMKALKGFGNVLMLFGLIPALFKLIRIIYTVLHENLCWKIEFTEKDNQS